MADETQHVQARAIAKRLADHPSINPHVNERTYKEMYKRSIDKPDEFWREQANSVLSWSRPFQTVVHGGFEFGDIQWFPEGQLNAAYNWCDSELWSSDIAHCFSVDRHAYKNPDKTAIIWESDEGHDGRKVSYGELLREVSALANVLKSMGVRKGDSVAIYLPMIPEAAVAFLACARIGAVHSVVFAGFSADALRDRIVDCKARVVLTTDEGRRGGKTIATKSIVDSAVSKADVVEHVVVVRRTGSKIPWKEGRDVWWHEAAAKVPAYCPPEPMNSEDPLFILYTSGSTGKPKGVVHTTAGYLLGAAMTVKYVFDVHEGDNFACMADVGWITGHTYIVYGPLCLGTTTTIFESTPVYPTPSRYWEVVQKYKITQFYTAPTAIRLLRKMGEQHIKGYDLSTLRTIGSVGEPIAPEAWQWYHEHVGGGDCAVVDTYWQTETGSIIITPLPGATGAKPGSATLPFFGIQPVLLDATSGKLLETGNGEHVEGVLAIKKPWPSIARTVYGDHARYLETYLKPYPGYYFTGDGAAVDKDSYHWIRGRVDDVINVSGHRLSTAEVEAALIQHPGVSETAVVGVNDEMTGQAVFAFVALKPEFKFDTEQGVQKELSLQIRKTIGPFASPKRIIIIGDLPKTRSGKIMRRILRKLSAGEGDQLGDLSTLAEPGVVDEISKKLDAK